MDIGFDWDDAVHLLTRSIAGAILMIVLSSLQKFRLGVTVTNPRGYVLPLLVGAVVGFLYGYYGLEKQRHIRQLHREISRRDETERKLRRFKRAGEAAGNAIYITDSEGKIEYINPAFEEISGYSESEAVGKTPGLLYPGGDSTGAEETAWHSTITGKIRDREVVYQRKNGESFFAYQTVAPISSDDTFEGYVGVLTDITEQKELENQLSESKERFESLFNSIRDSILVVDTSWHITDCNPAFTDLFMYEPAEIEGEPIQTVYEGDEEFVEMCNAFGADFGDPERTCTVTYQKKSGQSFLGETNVFCHRDADDVIVGFILLIRDVSEHRERLRQIQILDRVLRHNLTNRMQVIKGAAEMVGHSASGEIESHAETIVEAGDRLLETTSNAREITRCLREPLEPTKVDVVPIVAEAVSNKRERYPDAEITTSLPESAPVIASPSLNRAVSELIDNAIVHAESETPSIDATVKKNGETVTVDIGDDGPGIPERERQVLTNETDIGPLYHTNGLGLWLVNLIVRQSDGVLEFESNEPRGSLVTIQLQSV